MNPALNNELSTLVALARFRGGQPLDDESRQHFIDSLPSDWGKKMARAMLGEEENLTLEERQTLKVVRQIAGVSR